MPGDTEIEDGRREKRWEKSFFICHRCGHCDRLCNTCYIYVPTLPVGACVLPTDVVWAVLSELLAAVEEVAAERAAVEDVVAEAVEREASGCGHTSFCTSSRQYCLIWVCRYHCRSRERAEGETTCGSCCEDGVQVWSTSSVKYSLSESDSTLTSTDPGEDTDIHRVVMEFLQVY